MKITFENVMIKGLFVWKENGKRRQRTRVFSQTVNPFNLDDNGIIKTKHQIMDELLKERNEWFSVMKRMVNNEKTT